MKIIAGFILFLSISANAICQSKKLNKLLAKHAFTYATPPAFSIETSKEFVVPFIHNPEILYAMKWKDIDSIRIWDTGGFNIQVLVYGLGHEYRLCNNRKDTCKAFYLDSTFRVTRIMDQLSFELEAKSENGAKLITKSDYRKLISALSKLNNTPVTEDHEVWKNRSQLTIEPPKKGIIVYMADHLGEVYIPAKEIQEVKELRTVLSTIKIVSFKCYVATLHNDVIMVNKGEKFNEELLRAINRVRPGATIVFDEIKVENGQGKIETATTFVIKAI